MKIRFVLFLILFVYISGCNKESRGLKLYVSDSGNDSWSGRVGIANMDNTDGPFATVSAARNEIRSLKKEGKLSKGKILVEVQEGVYELDDIISFESEDGGKDSLSRIVYSGKAGTEVRLSGGRKVDSWEKVTDIETLELFYPGARGKVYMADLRAAGIKDFGSPEGGGSELFFNDKPMRISRYPNSGFVNITGLLNEDPVDVRGTKGDRKGKFFYTDERISKWVNEKDAWVHGYWFWDWSEQRHKIMKIDLRRRLIELVPPYHNYGYRKGQWFYGFNLLSEIDEPGEYYIDRSEGIIYFYPPSPLEEGKAYVSVNKNIIQMKDVTFVTIEGMIMEGCTGNIVEMTDCQGCIIRGCTLRNGGDNAIVINEGLDNGAQSCDIYEVGAGGIKIAGGDRISLTPSGNFADNNFIHHIARLKRVYNPGISISGVGNIISHNLIEHVPHMAIGFSGNDNIIEFNELNDVCFESNDAGAIYTGRNWTMRGNVIKYNYLRNISGFEGKGCVGIYLDDAFSSADITGNVFNNVSRAMMIGGGRDNRVLNNIFVNCSPSIHVDARGLGWMENLHIPDWIKEAEEKGTILGIAYNKPPYSERYPLLVNILNDEPRAPKGNVISNNICYGGVWDKASGYWRMAIEKKALPYLTMENNIVSPDSEVEDTLSESITITDPLFINEGDPEESDYQLDPESLAIKAGFVQIPFDKIGLYTDDRRIALPFSPK
ncbi:MAG TPA: right-handed parallel beta-helix repeat-containing protein [Bacteroidales bacterium]|nr:right-handed parallel beta-helix repeat-containing protein [Bacteroidales bacterium]